MSDAPHEPDAVEQLQRGLLTMIGAARVVLDALEVVVADRARLDDLTAGGRAVVGSIFGPLLGGCPESRGAAGPERDPEAQGSSEPGAGPRPG